MKDQIHEWHHKIKTAIRKENRRPVLVGSDYCEYRSKRLDDPCSACSSLEPCGTFFRVTGKFIPLLMKDANHPGPTKADFIIKKEDGDDLKLDDSEPGSED